MAKPIRHEKISDKLWIDAEPLRIADLYLHEDSDHYDAAVKRSRKNGAQAVSRSHSFSVA